MVREGRDDAGAGARLGDDDPRGAAGSREGSGCDRARLPRRHRRRRRRPARRRERADQRCPLGDERRAGGCRRSVGWVRSVEWVGWGRQVGWVGSGGSERRRSVPAAPRRSRMGQGGRGSRAERDDRRHAPATGRDRLDELLPDARRMARVAAPQSEPDDVSRADHERPGDRRQRSPRVPARRLSGDARRRRAVARRRSIHARARRRRVEDRDRRLHVDAPQVIAFRLPNPSVLLLSGVLVAAALTWVLPAGKYDRRDDAATGRRVAVPGTYHSVPRAPVGLLAAAVAVPRWFVAAADVIAVIFFVGGAWFIVDRLGTLPAVVGGLVRTFGDRGLYIIPVVSAFFGVMGAVENMQEEIIPLIPGLLVLGRGLGVDAVVVVSMSMGAAMVGSAFGPTNPFQAGIAMKLAQLPLFAAGRLRLAMFVVGMIVWIAWTMRYASRNRAGRSAQSLALQSTLTVPSPGTNTVARGFQPSGCAGAEARGESARAEARGFQPSEPPAADATWHPRHALILAIVVAPIGAYVYGALRLDWGFNELSGAFLIAAIAAGLAGGLSLTATVVTYIEGMREVVSAALMIGIARSISLVLEDGHVIDTILYALASALTAAPKTVAALLMVPSQALIHIPVPSVSGHAMLTVPVFVALGDLLGMSRQVPVLAYQTGAGLMELLTPTNGALMAILLAAGVPYQRWVRFTIGGVLLLAAIGILAIAV